MKVFLGGTCNGSHWRNDLIKLLEPDIDYFNPVVPSWSEDARLNEEKEKLICDYNLFVFTPKMSGLYSIAEVSILAVKQPEKTLFCILEQDGNTSLSIMTKQNMEAIKNLLIQHDVICFSSLHEVAEFLNSKLLTTNNF